MAGCCGCLDDLADGVMVVIEEEDLDKGFGTETTSLPLVSCLDSCSCGGAGTGETETAVIEAEWA